LALNDGEIEEAKKKISNSSFDIDKLVEICCKSASLWENGSIDIRRKIQNLIFPEGVFWNNENKEYLTKAENKVFTIFRRLSGSYNKRKRDCSV
jgi:hypothetical protein